MHTPIPKDFTHKSYLSLRSRVRNKKILPVSQLSLLLSQPLHCLPWHNSSPATRNTTWVFSSPKKKNTFTHDKSKYHVMFTSKRHVKGTPSLTFILSLITSLAAHIRPKRVYCYTKQAKYLMQLISRIYNKLHQWRVGMSLAVAGTTFR